LAASLTVDADVVHIKLTDKEISSLQAINLDWSLGTSGVFYVIHRLGLVDNMAGSGMYPVWHISKEYGSRIEVCWAPKQ
jgi:hypothetical protein